ncbi:sensor histidine kinase [Sabulibacter ruber]|uniref:sensor histidine kinase n=1 Tax=Sabulibacter ruber TaxID=2811901 RepID=UPI001A969007|nr:ATP-binding protein [Sabulibacter ruber]
MKHQEQTCQEQLEALKKEYEEFVYIVSHDLKAPLRAISNLSGWIKEDVGDNLDPDIQHNIHLLQNRAERMERMINGLLQFSRVSRYDLEVREVNVQDLIQELTAPLEQSNGLEVRTQNLPVLTTYPKKLEAVFYQLLQNAVKFNNEEKPQVWIEAQELESTFRFTVKDNGVGISPDAHEKIFRIFYSVKSKDQQEDVGVGLSLVRRIIQFVGGEISVDSEVGQGSTFTFTWPKTV